MASIVKLTHAEWVAAAKERYATSDDVAFVCPVCKHRQTYREVRALCVDDQRASQFAGFSCIGRLLPREQTSDAFSSQPGPCSYAGGGLLRINPIAVVFDDGRESRFFDFADHPLLEEASLR